MTFHDSFPLIWNTPQTKSLVGAFNRCCSYVWLRMVSTEGCDQGFIIISLSSQLVVWFIIFMGMVTTNGPRYTKIQVSFFTFFVGSSGFFVTLLMSPAYSGPIPFPTWGSTFASRWLKSPQQVWRHRFIAPIPPWFRKRPWIRRGEWSANRNLWVFKMCRFFSWKKVGKSWIKTWIKRVGVILSWRARGRTNTMHHGWLQLFKDVINTGIQAPCPSKDGWTSALRNVGFQWSMDWFQGKFTGKPMKTPYLMGKSMVSCRFSLKPIHWNDRFFSGRKIWEFSEFRMESRDFTDENSKKIGTWTGAWTCSTTEHREVDLGSPVMKDVELLNTRGVCQVESCLGDVAHKLTEMAGGFSTCSKAC